VISPSTGVRPAPKPWLDAEDGYLRARVLAAGNRHVEAVVGEQVYELETACGIRYARVSVIDRQAKREGFGAIA
jgi:hypothetical protein